MLTCHGTGKKFCVSVSNIKFIDADPVTKVYFKDGPYPWRYVKESIETTMKRIDKATEENVEFIDFLFTNGNERLCVKKSEIRYLKAGEGKQHKAFVEGIGEIEVYGDFNKITEALTEVTI